MSSDSPQASKILYCRCAYAQTVPQGVKDEVLQRLSDSEQNFEAVADLCEMSARKAPQLKEMARCAQGSKIVACYPRAVKWLFHAAEADLPSEGVEILNMRTQSADDICAELHLDSSNDA
jgi:hypothetical protein